MASKSCASCLRAFQRQSRAISNTPRFTNRAFATTSRKCVELPEPNATAATSIPPVSPSNANQGRPTTAAPLTRPKKLTTYSAYGMAEVLYKECASRADYTIPPVEDDAEVPKTEDGEDLGVGDSWWHADLGLKPTFSTWSQVTMLHMYVLAVRFRCAPRAESQLWQQHLLDHFFYDAENKMAVNHNMHARGTRNKYLKDLHIQWRGLLAAYDEGLAKGDAVLAAAIWRNVFKADEEIDIRKLAQIVSYVRRLLQSLDSLSSDELVGVQFGSIVQEANVVRLKSPMIDVPLETERRKDSPREKKQS